MTSANAADLAVEAIPLEGRGKYDLRVVTRLETLIGLAQCAQADRLVSMVAEERYRRHQPSAMIVIAC